MFVSPPKGLKIFWESMLMNPRMRKRSNWRESPAYLQIQVEFLDIFLLEPVHARSEAMDFFQGFWGTLTMPSSEVSQLSRGTLGLSRVSQGSVFGPCWVERFGPWQNCTYSNLYLEILWKRWKTYQVPADNLAMELVEITVLTGVFLNYFAGKGLDHHLLTTSCQTAPTSHCIRSLFWPYLSLFA